LSAYPLRDLQKGALESSQSPIKLGSKKKSLNIHYRDVSPNNLQNFEAQLHENSPEQFGMVLNGSWENAGNKKLSPKKEDAEKKIVQK